MFFFRVRAEKSIAWHIDASSVVWTLKDFFWSNVSILCYKTYGTIELWLHLGGLLNTQEAKVALGLESARAALCK